MAKPSVPTAPLYTLGPGGIGKKGQKHVGPEDPPPGFVTATTSFPEWILYWASSKVFNDPPDPRQPPYFGGKSWGYQLGEGEQGGAFGAVVDFVYYLPAQIVGVRLMGARYHEAGNPEQKLFDVLQRNNLARYIHVVDIYEQDFIADRTGAAACRRLVEALGGRRRISPAARGEFRKVRAYSI